MYYQINILSSMEGISYLKRNVIIHEILPILIKLINLISKILVREYIFLNFKILFKLYNTIDKRMYLVLIFFKLYLKKYNNDTFFLFSDTTFFRKCC